MSKFLALRHSAFAKVGIITILLLLIVLASLFFYLTYNEVAANNLSMKVTAELTAQSVIDKVDRNFYERFGDVQAFAVNKLSVQTAASDSLAPGMQEFIDTMTAYYVLYDLMMICGKDGTVLAVNSKNKSGKTINSSFLVRKNMSSEGWFKICSSSEGPKGGAWFSDYMIDNNVTKIYGVDGRGMAYAAPIRNENGDVIGAWYNYASWQEVTEGIRMEAEGNLEKDHPEAFALLTRENGEVISAEDPELLNTVIKSDSSGVVSLQSEGKQIDLNLFNVGEGTSHGAYTFEGKKWKSFTFIPKTNVSWAIFFSPKNFTAVGVSLLIMFAIGFFVYRFFKSNIITRLHAIREIQERLSDGEIVRVDNSDGNADEIGQMMGSLQNLTQSLQQKAAFADEIAKGNLTANLENVNERDVLGNSLLNMRNQLSSSMESEKQRNWATEGLAQVGTILRSYSSIEDLYSRVIKFAVTYLKANQGGLFLLNEDNDELVLESCYAYEKKKFITKTIPIGQGLVGQSVLEKQTIHLTDIPKDYIHITSGLGDASPNSIVIVPLKSNDIVLGAMEIASFRKLLPFELSLLEKLAESIAASVGTIRNNERTRGMVEQLQQQTEEMKSQEEEMRQNMEELSATQEEMIRKEQEYVSRISALENQ